MRLHTLSRRAAVAALLVAAVAVGCKKKAPAPAPNPPPGAPPVTPQPGAPDPKPSGPPAGWTEARDDIGGYRLLMPGQVIRVDLSKGPDAAFQPTGYTQPSAEGRPRVSTYSRLPSADMKLGHTADELFAAMRAQDPNFEKTTDLLERATVQLGGKPALKLVLKKKPSPPPPKTDIEPDEFFEKMRIEREQKEQAVRRVLYVTCTATRYIHVNVYFPGEPDPALLKGVVESFAFQ